MRRFVERVIDRMVLGRRGDIFLVERTCEFCKNDFAHQRWPDRMMASGGLAFLVATPPARSANTRAVMTINNGHLDLRGGDAYELDNDNLPLRSDPPLSTIGRPMPTRPMTRSSPSTSRVLATSRSKATRPPHLTAIRAPAAAAFALLRTLLFQVRATMALMPAFNGPTRTFGIWASCGPTIRVV